MWIIKYIPWFFLCRKYILSLYVSKNFPSKSSKEISFTFLLLFLMWICTRQASWIPSIWRRTQLNQKWFEQNVMKVHNLLMTYCLDTIWIVLCWWIDYKSQYAISIGWGWNLYSNLFEFQLTLSCWSLKSI